MKRILLALALFLLPSLATAQCNGVFPNNTACGNISGASNLPRPVPVTSFPANAPGGTTGQIQYNAGSGLFGGFTASGDATINTATGAVTIAKLTGIANSILINPTGSTAAFQNLAIPACANDSLHALVYINGTGLQCASIAPGTITSITIASGLGINVTGGCVSSISINCTINQSLTNATFESSFSAPAGTTTSAMMGLGSGCKLTPAYSGRVRVEFVGNGRNSGANGNNLISLNYASSIAPVNGATVIGVQPATAIQIVSPALANTNTPFSLSAIITNMIVGTAYWFDLAITSNAGNTAAAQNISCNGMEF